MWGQFVSSLEAEGGGGTDQDSICIAMSLKAGKLSKGFKSSLYVVLQGCPSIF